jgi:ABC-type branched-subunit amino acid transport system substrate-binding protein
MSTWTVWLPMAVLAALLVLVVGGCGGSSGGRGRSGSLTGPDLEQAHRLYAQLQREHSLERDRKALDLAGSLLDYYPSFPRNDEVLGLAIGSAARLGDRQRALALTDELLARFGKSPLVDQALLRGAELAEDGGDTLRAATYLIGYFDRDPARGARSDGKPRVARLVDKLNHARLEQLMESHAASGVWPYLGLANVRSCLAAGLTAEAGDVGARLQAKAPKSRWTVAALELLAAPGVARRQLLVAPGEVQVDHIGVLVPFTGRYAVLGNAFFEATMLAVKQSNQEFGTSIVLRPEDTAADPVTAALAARKLCAEDGCLAVLGALLSAPTAAAAVVCDAYGTPLLSPTATYDNIWQLGPGIFQTNITGLYEVRLLAQLATSILLKERFGIIYPDTPEGLQNAQVFTAEIEARGGQVVATAAFAAQSTDFRTTILEVRKQRPEVLFVPASVDQMVQLGPQLDFYRAGSLVLGLSNWNSDKLRGASGSVLERAVFPDDLVLFPVQWEEEFNQNWNPATYPPEATAQALKAYQATRMLLDTMAQSGAVTRQELTEALTRRLANRDLAVEGPDSFAATMRMFRNEQIVPFPAGIFAAGWQQDEAAAADSLGVPVEAAPDGAAPAPVPPVNGRG